MKIIAAFDGLKYSESTQSYAIQIAKQNKAHLVGIFLEDESYTSYKIYDLVSAKGGIIGSASKKLDKKDTKKRACASVAFRKACIDAGIEYSIHHDRSRPIHSLLHESIYADLLIIDSSETFGHHQEKAPTPFIHDLLGEVQCPVLIVPRSFQLIRKLFFLYDGEPSSVHAIKMLSYTLASLQHAPVEIVSVNPMKQPHRIPDSVMIKEFMKHHFPNAMFTVLTGLPEIEIVNYLKEEKDISLIVLGAYRRGMVSRWFRESMADVLMKDLKLPLFIAHNK